LQRLLTRSRSGKLLAVKRVTENERVPNDFRDQSDTACVALESMSVIVNTDMSYV
jgi:N-terminal domain of reverse transcriptase